MVVISNSRWRRSWAAEEQISVHLTLLCHFNLLIHVEFYCYSVMKVSWRNNDAFCECFASEQDSIIKSQGNTQSAIFWRRHLFVVLDRDGIQTNLYHNLLEYHIIHFWWKFEQDWRWFHRTIDKFDDFLMRCGNRRILKKTFVCDAG